MANVRTTAKAQRVIEYVRDHPGCTTREVGLNVPIHKGWQAGIYYDQAHGILTRLAGKGVVKRLGRPAKWEATDGNPRGE